MEVINKLLGSSSWDPPVFHCHHKALTLIYCWGEQSSSECHFSDSKYQCNSLCWSFLAITGIGNLFLNKWMLISGTDFIPNMNAIFWGHGHRAACTGLAWEAWLICFWAFFEIRKSTHSVWDERLVTRAANLGRESCYRWHKTPQRSVVYDHHSSDSIPVYKVSSEPLGKDISDVLSPSGPAFGPQLPL